MKKSKSLTLCVIFVIILIAYILATETFFNYLQTLYFFNPLLLASLEMIGALILGMSLAIPGLIKLKAMKGHYTYNLTKALIIGVPTFILGLSIYLYYGTDIPVPRILVSADRIREYLLIACGLFAISSIEKK